MANRVDTAMIMAAGKGTRMMPLTADRPKPLVEVAGVALLDHVLHHLRSAGIGKVVINAHYRAAQVEAHMAEHAVDFDVAISDERDVLLDTGGGLVRALPMIGCDPFLCVNADNWWTDEADAAANNSQGQGDFDMDRDGRLSRRRPDAKASYVWTGIQMLSKRLIVDPPSAVFSTNIFWDRAIAAGRCFGLEHNGLWFDVGYPAAIAATEQKLTGCPAD
jgi:N-acetyl-alpha-D-muramate 1-phosphate uridylyltransferase